jgi:hypothetical protein
VHGIFVVIAAFINHRDLHRINRDDLQIHPALIALDLFALFHIQPPFFRTSSMIRVRPPTYSNLFPYRMMNTALADTLLII